MASYGWRESRSVAEGLFEEGHRFAFLQAVRLLEELYDERTPPGEGVDPQREVVRFRHAVRMDFPPGDVESVHPGAKGEPAEMVVNILGLAGALGPLPPAVSELIVERTFRKDKAFRDFLDIFNHRLVSLLYRARKKYRPAIDTRAPDRGRVATVLYSFLGLSTPHLLGRMEMRDRALLPYAGLCVDRYRSTAGLVRLLEDYFGVPVDIAQFAGRWDAIEDDDVTRIGESGQNQLLGGGAVLGRRLWSDDSSFRVQLGALTFVQFLSFLPNGSAFRALVAAVQFYVREELGFTIGLTLAAAEVPVLRLGAGQGIFLGWTSWLKRRPSVANDSQVKLMGRP
ncbi:MAG: type VI secretion system baseplate subunit TssG [Acidobacteria bacterium]|nr:type VI secretion system baseplate subunit TssG [Acidobacteriota bacterium]MBV9068585.1 type VI secretion system baseplate subunit TssG [Acidobacteriota bacterium]MBV9186733.1 type VI secretion system baseplate subunit TssG [Acidobacteriota bacterium]